MRTGLRGVAPSVARIKRAKDDSLGFQPIRRKPWTCVGFWRRGALVAYFRVWYATSLLWRASARHPIPDEWRTVGPRASPGLLLLEAEELHPVNAILNYTYAVLQSQVQIRLVSEGYEDRRSRSSPSACRSCAAVHQASLAELASPGAPIPDRSDRSVDNPQLGDTSADQFLHIPNHPQAKILCMDQLVETTPRSWPTNPPEPFEFHSSV